MDTVVTNITFGQPKTLAELLPGLSGIVSKESMKTFLDEKQPRSTTALTRTTEKNVKVLTIAEMQANILALSVPKRKCPPPPASTKKRNWNSSVKVQNKTTSHTADGQLKNNSVRKVLIFQPKPKAIPNPRITVNPETPKFPKPELRAKKSLHPQVSAKSTVRISGICNMPQTPVITNKLLKNRFTLANKENFAPQTKVNSKPQVTPVVSKKVLASVPATPLSNMSWKSGSDTSFLQNEKDIQDIEDKPKTIADEPTLENIAEVTPPVSTPFKEYRNVQEFFNHSNDTDSSALYNDNTIMCFDKMSISKEKSIREESVIVSLCDLLNKASVANVDKPKTELNDLLEVEKQLEHNIKMVENGINTLTNIKESQLKTLHQVKKLINEKNTGKTMHVNNNILIKAKSMSKLPGSEGSKEIEPVSSKSCSVIKSKSPSYKIPKKNQCLRKKIIYKSMPNVSEVIHTPNKDMDKRAFNMYMEMKMKEQMSFLNTPRVTQKRSEVPDTPTVTSHNLQMQLDKIYQDNT
ncbi:uncharacterized protein [Epargyreus clarus]|uniref:uncharacterized protein n=1 Tax=Epargyreus clarus TaxID=520877 RepID=UPI003C2D9C30